MKKLLLLLLCVSAPLLVSCGFEPVYGVHSNAINGEALPVSLEPIAGRHGQILRNALEDRINPKGRDTAAFPYRMSITISVTEIPGIIEPDGSISRYNLVFRSRYKLYRKSDGALVDSGKFQRAGSYNVAQADFSSFTAQNDAISRSIVSMSEDYRMRLAAFFADKQP